MQSAIRAVAAGSEVPLPIDSAVEGWLPPGDDEGITPWALDNRAALETFAQGIEQEGTAAEQLQRFLSDQVSP